MSPTLRRGHGPAARELGSKAMGRGLGAGAARTVGGMVWRPSRQLRLQYSLPCQLGFSQPGLLQPATAGCCSATFVNRSFSHLLAEEMSSSSRRDWEIPLTPDSAGTTQMPKVSQAFPSTQQLVESRVPDCRRRLLLGSLGRPLLLSQLALTRMSERGYRALCPWRAYDSM